MIKKWFSKRTAVGAFIDVAFPGLHEGRHTAKVDTGAYSGALHASNIREVKGAQGQKLLEFLPFGDANNTIRLEAYQKRAVTSSNGQSEIRFFIQTEIEINGNIYPIEVSLADRSQLKHPVLIGRRFLGTHKFVIDLAHKS